MGGEAVAYREIVCESGAIPVGPEPTVTVAPEIYELYEALLLEQVQMSLDSPWASGEPLRQGLHAGPAEPGFVGVTSEGAVG